jgi:hypothetical protein
VPGFGDRGLKPSGQGADSGNRTRIRRLEGCGPAVGRCPRSRTGETRRRRRAAWGRAPVQPLASPGCRPGTLPLSYDPDDGRLVGESNPSHSMDSGAATPVASRGSGCDGWESNPPPRVHGAPSSQTSTVTTIHIVGRRGLAPRSPALQAGAITRLAHDPRFAPEPSSGIEPEPPAYETGARPIELRGRSGSSGRNRTF